MGRLKLNKYFMRVRGIEPRSIAWEAIILPLNHTRLFFKPPPRFELGTSALWKLKINFTLKNWHKRSAGRRTVFDLRDKKENLIKLEQESIRPGFWDDNEKAQKIAKEIAELKETVSSWEKILEDAGNLADLNEAHALERKFNELERSQLFSGS